MDNRFGICSCGKVWQGEGLMLKCSCGKLVPLKTGEQQIQAGIKAISELAQLKHRVERMQAVVDAARYLSECGMGRLELAAALSKLDAAREGKR